MEFKMGNFSISVGKLMALIGGIIACIGCFSPFASVEFFGMEVSADFMEGDGKLVLPLLIVGIVLAFIKIRIAFIANGIALAITFMDVANVKEKLGAEALAGGAYMIIIGCIIAIIGSFMPKPSKY